MRYRDFGRTGLKVSELIFGGGAVGGILIDADDDTRRTAIRKALDGGINWIDTAPLYGDGRSEKALGWLLAELPAEERPYLSTKVRVDTEVGDIPGQIERSMHASLERLRRERVDVIQLHNRIAEDRNEFSGALSVAETLGEALKGLERLREQGLTDFIGFTANGETAALRQVVENGCYDSAQIYYNMINPSAGRDMSGNWSAYDFENLIERCRVNGVAVMVIRVLAAGVLATDVRHGREGEIIPGGDVGTNEAQAAQLLEAVGEGHGKRAQVAVRYALANPGVSGVLMGIAELDHIDQALGAVDMGPLPGEVLERIHALVDADFYRG